MSKPFHIPSVPEIRDYNTKHRIDKFLQESFVYCYMTKSQQPIIEIGEIALKENRLKYLRSVTGKKSLEIQQKIKNGEITTEEVEQNVNQYVDTIEGKLHECLVW